MIVMGYASNYCPFPPFENKLSVSAQLQPLVLDPVNSFHEQGLVRGDLRGTNVLVREDPESLKFKLVDFDWAGKEGESRYPSTLSSGGHNGYPMGRSSQRNMI
jgi:hypothetical protein